MAELLGEAGGDLFNYNREGWKFGAELRQRDLYQRQKMRIRQVDLYREDIRDLFDLTVGKMDKYVIVCLVMLSITMELFYKGRNPVGTPSWLFWCWSICTAGAMFYLFMAIWLALHASISAQTFSVRCLTQWLRLPIPSSAEISIGAAKLEEYEKSGKLLRVPVIGKGNDSSNGLQRGDSNRVVADDNAPAEKTLLTDWELFSTHFNLFNHLHRKWQGYEAYARVCMCMGMNHFLAAMSYFSLALYAIKLGTPWSGWAFIAMFQGSAVLHARLNLNLTYKETLLMMSLVVLPSLFLSLGVAIVLTATSVDSSKNDFGPCIFACIGILGHVFWVLFFLKQTKSDINGLPVKFSSVWCIDVLGIGMETLREVQEPVGKKTYSQRLSSRRSMNLGQQKSIRSQFATLPTSSNPLAGWMDPSETEESIARSKLPWLLFKVGSGFMVCLWILAFVQTIVLPFGVNTGTTLISNALFSIHHDVHVTHKNEHVHMYDLTRQVSLLEPWFLGGGDLVANSTHVWVPATGTVLCTSTVPIVGLTGSISNPSIVVEHGNETWTLLYCLTGTVTRLMTQFVAADGAGQIVALLDGVVHVHGLDGLGGDLWEPISGFTQHRDTNVSMSLTSNSLYLLNVGLQRIDVYDFSSLKIVSVLSVRDSHFEWTQISQGWLRAHSILVPLVNFS